MKGLRRYCIAAGIVPPMQDFVILVSEFFRQDPFRALGLLGFACVAVSMTTNFDLLHVLGFIDVAEEQRETKTV